MARNLWALAAGLLFGLGLAVSQMVNPWKVLAFLDIAGDWDPSLLLVMGAAVVVNVIGYRLVLRRPHPLCDVRFHVPEVTRVDAPLLAGAGLFGVGWGLAGYCPGPGIAALSFAALDPLWFVVAMTAGMFLHRLLHAPRTDASPAPRSAPPGASTEDA